MRNINIFLVLLFVLNSTHAQGIYDVLPTSGRNELFHTYLMDRGAELWDARRDSVASSILSDSALLERKAQLKADYLELLGDMPEKKPLNPVIVDTIQKDGYRIEKLHFQSRPDFHVTGNFYIPDTGAAPFPTVLILCGHYPEAKGATILHKLSVLFALNGIAALIVDPFSQGERYQIKNPNTGRLSFTGESGTSAHSRLDVGSVLVGRSVVAHALWDSHRSMDYLYSRTDIVDTSRVGCTGSSGGGSQAMYLCAFDERIKVAAVNSLIMNEETLFGTIGPQTASQNLAYEGAHLIDHPDYITMFAPKPYMVLGATQDFFDITATRSTAVEAQNVYTTLGVPEKFEFVEEDNTHGYTKRRREEAVRWFRSWFYNDTDSVGEPSIPFFSSVNLWVTDTGQVAYAFANERNITDINVAIADSLEGDRADFWAQNSTDSCLNKVRELLRLSAYDSVEVEYADTIARSGYSIIKLAINSGNHVPLPGLLFVPDGLSGPAPAVVYVDGRGKKVEAPEGDVIEKLFLDSGKVVLSVDLRGFGETADNPAKNESKHGNNEHRNSVIANYIGKTLIGQRVEDIMKALDVISARAEVDTSDLTLIGVDRAGSAVVHAAALDPRVKQTLIRKSFESWVPMVGQPTVLNNLTHTVPFALKYYDLTNLVDVIGMENVAFSPDYFAVPVSNEKTELDKRQGNLFQNYPNPSRGETIIPFQTSSPGQISLKVMNLQGREIISKKLGYHAAGQHELAIELDGLASGMYFYQMNVNDQPIGTRVLEIRK